MKDLQLWDLDQDLDLDLELDQDLELLSLLYRSGQNRVCNHFLLPQTRARVHVSPGGGLLRGTRGSEDRRVFSQNLLSAAGLGLESILGPGAWSGSDRAGLQLHH